VHRLRDQVLDEAGRVVGYQDLDKIGETLRPVLLRRRKSEVLTQLPARVAKTIFVPTANVNPRFPQNCLQFSNPTVDQKTGILYVPFLRFSNANQDFIQMLISEDAGDTFHFAKFNIPGAPDPTVMPVTQPGELTACGGTNIRLTIHGLANPGPGNR